jgi:benzodiazapine receptor
VKHHWALLVFLALVALAGYSGVLHLPGPFYEALSKPDWTPPNRLFPPVWTVLYVMIAFAGWIVWRAQGFGPAMWVWLVQLALNVAWSWIMFGQKEVTHALYDIVALWVAILLFMRLAWPVRRSATLLFVPYFLWVTYAAALNFEIWRLNS